MKKKSSFSLIELIVSLGLLSLLLSALFSWYHTLAKQKATFKQLKVPLMEERYAHQRLQQIFSRVKTPFFSGDDGSLIFIFDRGPSPVPALSGILLGRLYCDATSRSLCLGIWPRPTSENAPQEPSQTHILLDLVVDCRFTYYNPPDPFKKPVDPPSFERDKPQEEWQELWQASYQKLPALVKISLQREEQRGLERHAVDFFFDLPVPIVYSKEGFRA